MNRSKLSLFVSALASRPGTLAVIRFGSARSSPQPEIDLLAVVTDLPLECEGVLLRRRGLRIDLFLREFRSISDASKLSLFELAALAEGEYLFLEAASPMSDLRDAARARAAADPAPPTAADVSNDIHKHASYLAKMREKRRSDPVAARFFVARNLSRLLFSYARLRGYLWAGESRTLRHIRTHDPPLYRLIARLLSESDLDVSIRLSVQITRRVLAPVGGLPSYSAPISLGACGPRCGQEILRFLELADF